MSAPDAIDLLLLVEQVVDRRRVAIARAPLEHSEPQSLPSQACPSLSTKQYEFNIKLLYIYLFFYFSESIDWQSMQWIVNHFYLPWPELVSQGSCCKFDSQLLNHSWASFGGTEVLSETVRFVTQTCNAHLCFRIYLTWHDLLLICHHVC